MNEKIILRIGSRVNSWPRIKYRKPLTKTIKNDIVDRLFILQKTEQMLHIPFKGRIWCTYQKAFQEDKRTIDATGIFEWSGSIYIIERQINEFTFKSYRADRMQQVVYQGIEHQNFNKYLYDNYFRDILSDFAGSLFLHPEHFSRIAPGLLAIATSDPYLAKSTLDQCKAIMHFSFLASKLGSWADYARYSRSLAAWTAVEFFDRIEAKNAIAGINLKSAKFPYAALTDTLARLDRN